MQELFRNANKLIEIAKGDDKIFARITQLSILRAIYYNQKVSNDGNIQT